MRYKDFDQQRKPLEIANISPIIWLQNYENWRLQRYHLTAVYWIPLSKKSSTNQFVCNMQQNYVLAIKNVKYCLLGTTWKVRHLTASNQNNKLWYYYTWHVLDISLNTTITGKFYFLEKGYFLHELKFFSDHKYQVAVSCIDLKRSLIYIHLKKWWIFCCHNLNLLAQSDVDPTTQH